jgi:hypothetical protein
MPLETVSETSENKTFLNLMEIKAILFSSSHNIQFLKTIYRLRSGKVTRDGYIWKYTRGM